jgi:hypothetical protein
LPGRAAKATVLLNVPPEARKYHTLLITEEHVDERPASDEEVALKGEVPYTYNMRAETSPRTSIAMKYRR